MYGAVYGCGEGHVSSRSRCRRQRCSGAERVAVLVGIEELDRRCGLVDVVDIDDVEEHIASADPWIGGFVDVVDGELIGLHKEHYRA